MQRRKGRWASWAAAALLLVAGAAASVSLEAAGLSVAGTPSPRSVPGILAQNRSFPAAGNGYLLSYARTIESGAAPSVFLAPLHGGPTVSLPFWLPHASRIRVNSGAVTPDGQVLLAGSFVKVAAASGGEERDVNFVARLDGSGRVLAVHRLGDYTPERICAAGDGTYWTLGQVWSREAQVTSPEVQGAYAMLRQFSPDGALRGSYLSRSELPTGRVFNYRPSSPQANVAFLQCGRDSVAAYVGRGSQYFLWTEVNATTGQTQSRSVRTLPSALMTGLAVLGEHSAYASFRPGGLYRLEMIPSRPAHWVPVIPTVALAGAAATFPVADRAPETGASAGSVLLGRDGSSLVHLAGTRSPSKDPTVFWSTPAR